MEYHLLRLFSFFKDAPKKPAEDVAVKILLTTMSFTGSDSQTETLLSLVLEQYVQFCKKLFLMRKLHLCIKEGLKR